MRQKSKLKRLPQITSVITCITFLAGLLLSCSNYAFADSEVDEVVVAVPSSCTFELGGGGTYNVELDNNDSEVVTANDITVSCNDASGYAIYAIGFSGDSYYGTNTDLISATDTSYNIKTDGTGNYGSSWKMKLAAVSNATIEGSYSSAWQNIPATYVKVASFNTNTTNGIITPSYQINISATQIAGTYTGKVKYTLVHPATAAAPVTPLDPSVVPNNTIVYAPNTSEIIGSMSSLPQTTTTLTNASPQAGAITAYFINPATLVSPNYKREGYGFAGWSTSFDATTATNPVIYGPNETISTNPANGGLDVSSGVVLYPVWIESSGNLQEWDGCSDLTPASYNDQTGELTATLSSVTALTDTRDGNVYTVARLADGLCWMTENLRLNNEHTTSSVDIAKAQGYGDDTANNRGRFIGLADSEDANLDDNTTANTLYSTDGSNDTVNIGTTNSPAYRIPRYNNNNTNMAMGATNSDGITALNDSYNANNNHVRWYSYGNYYNWPAAMASTTYYTSYSGTNGSDAAGTSLCPLGWHLPLGDVSSGTLTDGANDTTNRVGGFSYLDRKIGGTGQYQSSTAGTTQSEIWRKFPNNFVYSGAFIGAQASERGTYGYYRSSSARDYYGTNDLSFNNNSVQPGMYFSGKNSGQSVRCVAGS